MGRFGRRALGSGVNIAQKKVHPQGTRLAIGRRPGIRTDPSVVTDTKNAPRQEAPPWYLGRKFGGQAPTRTGRPAFLVRVRSCFVQLFPWHFPAPKLAPQERSERPALPGLPASLRPAGERPIGPLPFWQRNSKVDTGGASRRPSEAKRNCPDKRNQSVGRRDRNLPCEAQECLTTIARLQTIQNLDAGTWNEAPEAAAPRVDGLGHVARRAPSKGARAGFAGGCG
jgi:hypothetical protein